MIPVTLFFLGIFLMFLGWDFETVSDIVMFVSGVLCWVFVAGPAVLGAFE